MSTSIRNVSRRRVVIELSHPTFHHKRWGFNRQLVVTREHNPRTGTRGIRETRRACPGTLTVLRGQTIEGLPDAIAAVPDVRRLVAAGAIELVSVADPAPAAKPAPASEAAQTAVHPENGRARKGSGK